MTLLALSIDSKRYGVDVRDVVLVMPVPPLRPLDAVPRAVAGVFRFRGELIPVIDLTQLHANRPSVRAFDTRLIVVQGAEGQSGRRRFGLVAEHVNDVVEASGETPDAARLPHADSPWFGPLLSSSDGSLFQTLRVEGLASGDLMETLSGAPDTRSASPDGA